MARLSPTSILMMQLSDAGIPRPKTEVRFHPTRRWRLDLAWPDLWLAVEVHGGVWSRGRHTRGLGFTEDRAKMNEAQLHGWRVLEVTTDQINDGRALWWIKRAISQEGA